MHMVQSPSCCDNAQIHLHVPGLCGVVGVAGVGGGVDMDVACTLAIVYL